MKKPHLLLAVLCMLGLRFANPPERFANPSERLRRVLTAVLWLLLLAVVVACSKDDDAPAVVTKEEAEVEICIFFAPNELGDKGYADQVLTALFLFDAELKEKGRHDVSLRYVSFNDLDEVRSELLSWNRQNVNPFTRKPYRRRLMVLTDPILLPTLEDVLPDSASEVLVMNASNALFEQVPHYDTLGPRLHLLSISAAEAARKFCLSADRSSPSDIDNQFWLLQSYDDFSMAADSIGVVIYNYITERQDGTLFTMTKNTYDGDIISLGEAYRYAHFLPLADDEEGVKNYMVCGWGGLNVAISSLILAQGVSSAPVLFLDTNYAALRGTCHVIARQYDIALQQWLSRWLDAPPATMPAREWHGDWDGYVFDDL